MADLKFCPKCGAERAEGAQTCTCGYVYPKKGLSGCAIAAIVIAVMFIPTLMIIGVIAALTVPTLVNRQNDVAAQVKIKKSIANYEDIAYIYMIEKEKKSLAGAFGYNCENADEYFKIVESQGCNFTTADGVYWEVDPYTGYAAATDNKDQPVYGVVMWAENEKVNDENNIPSNLKMPSKEPVNCTFYPQTFARATATQLRELCQKQK